MKNVTLSENPESVFYQIVAQMVLFLNAHPIVALTVWKGKIMPC